MHKGEFFVIMKTYFIKTYGCQQNTRDSEIIETLLQANGLQPVSKWREADLVILNSCSVRQASEDKIYGLGREVIKVREQGKDLKVIVTGCLVGSTVGERRRFTYKQLIRKLSWVDGLVSATEIETILELLYGWNWIDSISIPQNFKAQHGKTLHSHHAYVNISTGCDNFCTYCVVPYARGEEVSRSKQTIINEIQELIAKGMTHVTLLGQNVNSWGLSKEAKFQIRTGSDQKLPFADLLRTIHNFPEIEQISFLSSNPFDFTKDLIDVYKLSKIDTYLHIAVQSGDNTILEKMNRRHKVEEFISLIDSLRKVNPALKIGTDIIVGFPGETEEAFEATVSLCKRVRFDLAYVSMYSPRTGTGAAKMVDTVSKAVVK